MGRFISALVLALFLVPAAHGDTIRVPGDQPTIQAGIIAAAPGDTVLVAAGTYIGPGNRNLDFGGKALVLRSAAGAAQTIIDCQNAGRGFDFHSGETLSSSVEGFTIRRGSGGLFFGGGMSVSGASPTIRNCILELNRANTGGGLFFTSSSSSISGCTFSGNVADNWGGALYAEGSTLSVSSSTLTQNAAGFGAGLYLTLGTMATVTDCSFTGNAAANLAGGIHCGGSGLTLTRCQFTQNTGKRGAGLYCINGPSATLDSCTFVANTATFLGAGIYGEAITSLAVNRCGFTDNETLTGPAGPGEGAGSAGILCADVNSFTATNTGFFGNSARGSYGSGRGLAVTTAFQGSALVSSCTFSLNFAGSWGGGAYLGSSVDVTDCSFASNEATERGGGLAGGRNVTRCIFTGNHAGDRGGAELALAGGVYSIAECTYRENTALNRGGAVQLVVGLSNVVSLSDCFFSRNSAATGGGVYLICDSLATFSQCTFAENAAVQGGALYVAARLTPPQISLTGCTLVKNAASFGAGVDLSEPVAIQNTIIAFSTSGEAVRCVGDDVAVLSCTDIYGNAGGDWVGCITDQLGINGCFAADPRLCNLGGGDYTLAETSPCAPANAPAGCGLIGAYPVSCVAPIGVAAEDTPALDPVLRVLPNPVTGAGTVVEWSQRVRSPVVARLYDVGGRLLLRRELGVRGPGLQRASWFAVVGGSRLVAGLYFLDLGRDGGASNHGGSTRVLLVP